MEAARPAQEPVSVVVAISDDHVDQITELARQMRDRGLRVERILRTLGTVTGRIQPSKISEIAGLDGVTSIEQERDIQLPPPDSPVQ
jgi:hypothetical protein